MARKKSGHHWILIMFVIGAAIGYLLGSGIIEGADLLNPFGLIETVLNGL